MGIFLIYFLALLDESIVIDYISTELTKFLKK